MNTQHLTPMIYLYIWLGFVAFIYLFMTIETVWHRYNIRKKFARIIDALTEDE